MLTYNQNFKNIDSLGIKLRKLKSNTQFNRMVNLSAQGRACIRYPTLYLGFSNLKGQMKNPEVMRF